MNTNLRLVPERPVNDLSGYSLMFVRLRLMKPSRGCHLFERACADPSLKGVTMQGQTRCRRRKGRDTHQQFPIEESWRRERSDPPRAPSFFD